ncbi:MAG TPA: uroporphyrinogen-III C-methyltransferase, partial [Isosphaeraceae bacterium]|nr:uroporphyrinogen-III C-methyltransferase [Isosphaeraceae bacterium]
APVGSVDLVGAGPGDPGLLTRRGFEALSRADVVVYDHLIHPRLLDLAPPLAERIFAGKRTGRFVMPQEEMNRLLVRLAREGKRVVRLKGGDPFVFGRGAEEAECLQADGIPFRVVPGVTAGVGVSAYAGIPVTHRGDASAVAFITGHDDPTSSEGRLDWSALARFPGTLVIYMGVGRLASICEVLIRHGRDPETPSALVQSGTLPTQRTFEATLATLPEVVQQAQVGPPALVVIGEVLRRRSGLAWFERLPLFGQRIVVTRPSAEMERAASDLEALGAEVIQAPTIEIRPLENFQTLDHTLRRLSQFDWLVFTSANGVRHLLDRLETVGMDLRALGSVKLAAIGPATASALASYRLRADLVPDSYRSEALAGALRPLVSGRRVLLARADRGRTILKDELSEVAQVEQVAVYRNVDAEQVPEPVLERLRAGSVDWVTLTSSAMTERLHSLLPAEAGRRIEQGHIRLAALSPVTADTARRLGWPVSVEASEFTWPGLVQALCHAAKGQ